MFQNMLNYRLTLMEVEMQPLSESLNRTWTNAYTARIENSDFDKILQNVWKKKKNAYFARTIIFSARIRK